MYNNYLWIMVISANIQNHKDWIVSHPCSHATLEISLRQHPYGVTHATTTVKENAGDLGRKREGKGGEEEKERENFGHSFSWIPCTVCQTNRMFMDLSVIQHFS